MRLCSEEKGYRIKWYSKDTAGRNGKSKWYNEGTAEILVGNIVNRSGTTETGKTTRPSGPEKVQLGKGGSRKCKRRRLGKGRQRGANASVLGGRSGHEEVAGPWPFQPW